MRKTLALLAIAAASLTATIGMARTPEQQRFVRDGQTYVYTTAKTGDAAQVIDGHAFPSGTPFHLVVRGDRVSGTSNGTPVSFRLADVKPGKVEISAR